MRKAMEADYVSENINHWIDLFFGYKQSGQDAIDAYNLYSPELYESAWTKKALKDPRRRAEIEATMTHVGQIPPKLFSTPHPKRKFAVVEPAISRPAVIDLSIGSIYCANLEAGELLVSNSESLVVTAFRIEMNPELAITRIGSAAVGDEVVEIRSAGMVLLRSGKLRRFVGGMLNTAFGELANVTCIAVDGEYVAAVSDRASLNLVGPRLKYTIPFFGDAITCCAVSKAFEIAVCGTIWGNLVICELFDGQKSVTVELPDGYHPVKVMITAAWGFIVTYAENSGTEGENRLFIHTVNGKLARSQAIGFSVEAWCTWSSTAGFDYMLIGDEKGRIFGMETFWLEVKEPMYRCYEKVVSVFYRTMLGLAVLVLRDGHVIIVPYIP
jgi:hypothetical protein